VLEAEGELGVGEPQLARVDRVDVGPGLEVLGWRVPASIREI